MWRLRLRLVVDPAFLGDPAHAAHTLGDDVGRHLVGHAQHEARRAPHYREHLARVALELLLGHVGREITARQPAPEDRAVIACQFSPVEDRQVADGLGRQRLEDGEARRGLLA